MSETKGKKKKKKKEKKKKKTNLQIRATRYCDRSGADGGPTRSADEMQRSGFGEGFPRERDTPFRTQEIFSYNKTLFYL